MAFMNGSFLTSHEETNSCVLAPKTLDDSERVHCRTCHSPSLIIDWAQGDRVCTNCGVVDEDHVRDSRPEWKDFAEADDLARGRPDMARSGLVPVDETKWLGGLQPTTISRTAYGSGGSAYDYSARRKKLLATQKRIESLMEKQHAKALKDAQVTRKARHGKLRRGEECEGFHFPKGPEYERLLLQEEEDAQRSRDILYAEKWSIERAIMLHGHDEDSSMTTHGPLAYDHGSPEERQDLLKRLDKPLVQASEDLYRAYVMLQDASRKLHLPDRVLHESVAMLCKYATRRDGITVKGVSSRMTSKANVTAMDKKEAAERLRAYNKQKQNGALGAALLFLTARQLGWTRSLAEVCSSFQPQEGVIKGKEAFIKPKHCSKAITEVRAVFPHYGQSTGQPNQNGNSASSTEDVASIASFVEHATRKLELPPVALASVRILVQHYRKEQAETEATSNAKLSTICASMSLFVCLAGASLQRLAQQAQKSDSLGAKRKHGVSTSLGGEKPSKRLKVEKEATVQTEESGEESSLINTLFDDDEVASVTPEHGEGKTDSATTTFDVFSHSAIEYHSSEKRKYEMRRTWDSWAEQMPWYRSVSRIEQSCGVSRNSVLQFYKTKIFPQRHALLEVLQQDASSSNSSTDAPMASVLLKNIAAAAPLLNSKGQL